MNTPGARGRVTEMQSAGPGRAGPRARYETLFFIRRRGENGAEGPLTSGRSINCRTTTGHVSPNIAGHLARGRPRDPASSQRAIFSPNVRTNRYRPIIRVTRDRRLSSDARFCDRAFSQCILYVLLRQCFALCCIVSHIWDTSISSVVFQCIIISK